MKAISRGLVQDEETSKANSWEMLWMGEVRIIWFNGGEMRLTSARHVLGLKTSLILLGILDKLGYKYRCQGERLTLEEYLELSGNGSDLLETDKVGEHRLHVPGKGSKFLISNLAFDVHTLVKQIESTCLGHAEKLGTKVELGSKASVTQFGVEIIQSKSEWRLKSLRWNSS
ncbi:hypothetical protein CRG98_029876 [Punica granatum]|uniref:Uncharacterized protein n=1 Tax=Punica granatum TaxID=22663 RepID=A0A2I0J0F2_PUNGR|nr:hypothetical protein CRG98_029876 [Punica granatum]